MSHVCRYSSQIQIRAFLSCPEILTGRCCRLKTQELKNIRRLAQEVLLQRSDVETFLVSSLKQVTPCMPPITKAYTLSCLTLLQQIQRIVYSASMLSSTVGLLRMERASLSSIVAGTSALGSNSRQSQLDCNCRSLQLGWQGAKHRGFRHACTSNMHFNLVASAIATKAK